MGHNPKAIKVITIEIDECGYATVEECLRGKIYRVGGYPYKFQSILIKDISEMIKGYNYE